MTPKATLMGGGAATAVAPTVMWIASGCPAPMPEDTAILIATGICYAAHALTNFLAPIANYVTAWVVVHTPRLYP